MLQINSLRPLAKEEEIPLWEHKKHPLGNSGLSSYWVKWKLHPSEQKFFSKPKTMIIKFDEELPNIDNENISSLNEWKVTKESYSRFLPQLCEELNFFETMYDVDNELIPALFKIKYLIDVDTISYTMNNFDAFKDFVYKTIFTDSMKEKLIRMIDENYIDDIESENHKNVKNLEMLTILQRKKKSLEFKNEHVKALLVIAYGIKILSFIINHFCVMRAVNIQKNIMLFYEFYKDLYYIFDFDFDIYNKVYAYVENKVNSSYNFNKPIYEQQEIFILHNRL